MIFKVNEKSISDQVLHDKVAVIQPLESDIKLTILYQHLCCCTYHHLTTYKSTAQLIAA